MPKSATATAQPKWEKLAGGDVWAWHDHRIHYMNPIAPPQIKDAPRKPHHIFDWKVPATDNGKRFFIDGQPRLQAAAEEGASRSSSSIALATLIGVGMVGLFALRRVIAPLAGLETSTLPFGAADVLDLDLELVAEPVPPPAAAADERRPEVVQLVVVALEASRREEALEDLAEPDEEAGRDHAGDLARERLLPAAVEERALEEPGGADVVGLVLDLRGRPLLSRTCGRRARRDPPAPGRLPGPSSRRSARWTTRSG